MKKLCTIAAIRAVNGIMYSKSMDGYNLVKFDGEFYVNLKGGEKKIYIDGLDLNEIPYAEVTTLAGNIGYKKMEASSVKFELRVGVGDILATDFKKYSSVNLEFKISK